MNYDNNHNELINEETATNENVVNNGLTTKPKYGANKIYNVLTAIIYPAICAVILTIVFFSLCDVEDIAFIIRYIIGLALYGLSVFTILQTDAYLLVVPLPIITFYKVGGCETTKPLWLRIICGIISFILIIAPFLILLAN